MKTTCSSHAGLRRGTGGSPTAETESWLLERLVRDDPEVDLIPARVKGERAWPSDSIACREDAPDNDTADCQPCIPTPVKQQRDANAHQRSEEHGVGHEVVGELRWRQQPVGCAVLDVAHAVEPVERPPSHEPDESRQCRPPPRDIPSLAWDSPPRDRRKRDCRCQHERVADEERPCPRLQVGDLHDPRRSLQRHREDGKQERRGQQDEKHRPSRITGTNIRDQQRGHQQGIQGKTNVQGVLSGHDTPISVGTKMTIDDQI